MRNAVNTIYRHLTKTDIIEISTDRKTNTKAIRRKKLKLVLGKYNTTTVVKIRDLPFGCFLLHFPKNILITSTKKLEFKVIALIQF